MLKNVRNGKIRRKVFLCAYFNGSYDVLVVLRSKQSVFRGVCCFWVPTAIPWRSAAVVPAKTELRLCRLMTKSNTRLEV